MATPTQFRQAPPLVDAQGALSLNDSNSRTDFSTTTRTAKEVLSSFKQDSTSNATSGNILVTHTSPEDDKQKINVFFHNYFLSSSDVY